jgi:hypothetical protein
VKEELKVPSQVGRASIADKYIQATKSTSGKQQSVPIVGEPEQHLVRNMRKNFEPSQSSTFTRNNFELKSKTQQLQPQNQRFRSEFMSNVGNTNKSPQVVETSLKNAVIDPKTDPALANVSVKDLRRKFE